jgi:hypothetical protein
MKFSALLQIRTTRNRKKFFTKQKEKQSWPMQPDFSPVDMFLLSLESASGKVTARCRPRAVLDTARFLPVALLAQLSLDLNDSPTKIQLGLRSNSTTPFHQQQDKVVHLFQALVHKLFFWVQQQVSSNNKPGEQKRPA